jgi:allantoin racemase
MASPQPVLQRRAIVQRNIPRGTVTDQGLRSPAPRATSPGVTILAINPNRDSGCTAAIAEALAACGPGFETVSLADGPPAIASEADWLAVHAPLAALVRARDAQAYVIACVSDPAVAELRALTPRPVYGAFRSAVAVALARADRFGVIAFVAASISRQRRVLDAMGVEARCAASVPLDLPMATLTDPLAPRGALLAAAERLRGAGAGALVLGCAGLAGHAAWLRDATGLPVIEPIRAAGLLAMGDFG